MKGPEYGKDSRYNRNVWESVLFQIKPPCPEKQVWSLLECPRLTVVIVEPRSHEWLQPVLYNMAHVYGGRNDVALHIFHGKENEAFVKTICTSWKNVKYTNLHVNNLCVRMYNVLLTCEKFWTEISSEFVLIFQCDSIIRRAIDEVFFKYDYVGAPWLHTTSPRISSTHNVGNGGFSLRRVAKMLEICKHNKNQNNTSEDVFFSEHVPDCGKPDNLLARTFSVEHVWHPNPCGLHQSWHFHSTEHICNLLRKIESL
jgi:hypothetical protein